MIHKTSVLQQTSYQHPAPLSDCRKKSRAETDSPLYRHSSIPTSTSAESSPKQPYCGVDRVHIVSCPHEVRVYKNFLKTRYQRNQFPTYFKQPSPSIKKFINLELVHKKRENKEERIQSMTAKLHGDVTKYKNDRTSIDMTQFGEVGENQKLPRNVLIEGDPGVGKTTLVWEMCKEWGEGTLLQQWDLVVLVQLHDKDIRRATNLRDFFKFSPDSPVNEHHTQQRIEVVGFTKRDIDKYIKCKFSNDSNLLQSFKEYISSHQFILTYMFILTCMFLFIVQ